jgi:hypothetical protein
MGHHENEPTFLAIGRFIFEFSQLEYTLRRHIAHAARLDDKFMDSVITHDFAMLCTAARQILGESMSDERKSRFNGVINKCLTLNQERVRVAHGLWVPFREGGVVHHVTRSSLTNTRSIDQATHLEGQANMAQKLRGEIENLVYEL